MNFKFNWFLKGMVIAVALAFLWPSPGAKGGFLYPELLNKAGVALVFFLNGLGLPLAALHDGARRWEVHLLIQLATFLVFPLLGLAIFALTGSLLSADLKTGIFYLCALPSTVSSSVALTVAARGNVPVAVFNATLSSLIGVVLTPLWMAWLLGRSGTSFDAGPVILDLILWVVLPLALGQMARPLLADWAKRNAARIALVDRLTILLLVYTSFADTVKQGVWASNGALVVVEALVVSLLLFAIVLALTHFAAKSLDLPIKDQIAAVFCGSKKTLASGVPMAQLIFGASPALGLILLPIMIYHPLQLAIGGMLAEHWAARSE